jgi:hypothetical protein
MLVNWQRNNNDGILLWFPLRDLYTTWTMYKLGLSSSWGTSRICPAWSSCEHQLIPALSPIGARVWSHAAQKRLFIVLMTAAHISPNVFSLRNFLSNICVLFLAYAYCHSYLLYITFKQYLHPFITRQSFCHFFNSSWQADCSRSFMSDTVSFH